MTISENGVAFFGAGGHRHDGVGSTLINVGSYSIFDFSSNYVGAQSRITRQQTNKTAFEDFIVRTINSKVLQPAGITLNPNTLNGKVISADTITAVQIAANTITANELSSNIVLVNNIIRSNNYNGIIAANGVITSNGSAGWAITSAGNAEFANTSIRGAITANSVSTPGLTIFANGAISSANFSTSNTGVITATAANITGTITSTLGRIGPFDITASSFTSIGYNNSNYMTIANYGDVTIFSQPSTGGHVNMTHTTSLVGENIVVGRQPGGIGTNPASVNRYATMGADNVDTSRIRFTIVQDNLYKFLADSDGNVSASNDINADGAVYASDYFRSYGQTGWYNETYGGGIYMTDSSEVKVYGGKDFNVPGASIYTNNVGLSTTTLAGITQSTTDGEAGVYLDSQGIIGIARSSQMMVLNGTNTGTAAQDMITFRRKSGTGFVGKITTSGTVVTYGGTSDYRLKDNIESIPNFLNIIKNLNPVKFTWKSEPDSWNYGFLAHELSEVIPYAVFGEKDGVDEEGNPEYQQLDYKFLIPILAAGLKTAIEKIESLESRVIALEGV